VAIQGTFANQSQSGMMIRICASGSPSATTVWLPAEAQSPSPNAASKTLPTTCIAGGRLISTFASRLAEMDAIAESDHWPSSRNETGNETEWND
jgi:hypothetical protein